MKKIYLFILCAFSLFEIKAQWTKVSTLSYNNGTVLDTASLCFDMAADATNLYAATESGVFKSSDEGSNWTNLTYLNSITQGNDNTKCVSLISSGGSDFLFIGTTTKIYSSADNGSTWVDKSTGITSGSQINAIKQIGTTLLAAYQSSSGSSGGIYKSTDNGGNWTNSNNGLPSTPVLSFFVDGNTIYAGTGNGVYLSTDDGATWTAKNTGMDSTAHIHSIVKRGSTFFAGDTWGKGVYKSIDDGASWVTCNNDLPTSFCQIFDMLVIGGKIYIAVDGYPNSHAVYSSTDDGTTWTTEITGLPTGFFAPVLGANNNGTSIYTVKGFAGDVYKMGSGSDGIENKNEGSLKINIYPNPANTQLCIELPEYKNTIAELFNIDGQLLQRISLQSAKTIVKMEDLTSGIYLIKVKSFGGVTVKKIMVD